MFNGLSPNYLNVLVPQTVGESTSYNLRRPNNLRTITCRTTLYKNSFLPSVINDWNCLSDEMKNAGTLSAFKYRLNIDKPSPNKLYFFEDRKTHIIHARLRNKCSCLNEHLYLKNIVQSPCCICGALNQHIITSLNARFTDN